MDRVEGNSVEGSFEPAEKSIDHRSKHQAVHPFNRRQQQHFSENEGKWPSFTHEIRGKFIEMYADKDSSFLNEHETREDRHHVESNTYDHPMRVSEDPPYSTNIEQISTSAPKIGMGLSKCDDQQGQGVDSTHEAPRSPRNNLYESRAARVARLKHIRPKLAYHAKNNLVGESDAQEREESDAMSQSSFDMKKRLESSPLHKMIQQKRPQKTISISPPRSRDVNGENSEKSEKIGEKLKRISRSQSPAPRVSTRYNSLASEPVQHKKNQGISTGETVHPVFGYTRNTVKKAENIGTNSKTEASAKMTASTKRVDHSVFNATGQPSINKEAATQEKESYEHFSNVCSNGPLNVASHRIGNSYVSSPLPQRTKDHIAEKNNQSSFVDMANHSPNITMRRKKACGGTHDVEYAKNTSNKSVYLDPTLIEVGMSDESSISTISHKFSTDVERRDMTGYEPEQRVPGEFRLHPDQDLSYGKYTAAYHPHQDAYKLRNTIGRKGNDDDIFDGLEDDTLLNDTIFRFADEDDVYNQKQYTGGKDNKGKTRNLNQATSTSFLKTTKENGRSGMVVEESRANKSVISDITSEVKSKRYRESKRKDYNGGEVATIDENTAYETESYLDRRDARGSHTVDDTLGYTAEDETETQDSYDDESVIGFNTQECTKELILESAFYKMGCAVINSLTNALASQDVINQICQDPRSFSQVQKDMNSKQKDKNLQQVVRELGDQSDHSLTDSVTRKNRQDEERKIAQSKLFEYANQAMGRVPSNRHRSAQVLQPILSQTSLNGRGEMGSAFSISVTGDKGSCDQSSILSEVQTKALTEVSASLRSEGLKSLKLNRHKKWQVKYLKVSQDGKINTKCPKALLWLKNPSASVAKLPDLKNNGQGGFMFSKLKSIEALQNAALLDNIPKNLRKDFPSLQAVALDYECDEGSRQVILSFKNATEAEAFCSAIRVIKLWADRECSTLIQSNNKGNADG